MAKKSALVISAHAADFVWRCGGAIALHQNLGYEVTIVCLSFGERGESGNLWKTGKSLEEIKSIRRREAENAASALEAHDIQFYDLGDYPLVVNQDAKFRLVDLMRNVDPEFIMSHSLYDPYNVDHMNTSSIAIECRMIAQAWGHNPGEQVLGSPQLYLFEPHQTEQMGWKPDVFLNITEVWEKKRAALEMMEGQHHLWKYYENVAENRGNHFRRNSGGQSGGIDARYAEAFQSVYPRTVFSL